MFVRSMEFLLSLVDDILRWQPPSPQTPSNGVPSECFSNHSWCLRERVHVRPPMRPRNTAYWGWRNVIGPTKNGAETAGPHYRPRNEFSLLNPRLALILRENIQYSTRRRIFILVRNPRRRRRRRRGKRKKQGKKLGKLPHLTSHSPRNDRVR